MLSIIIVCSTSTTTNMSSKPYLLVGSQLHGLPYRSTGYNSVTRNADNWRDWTPVLAPTEFRLGVAVNGEVLFDL